MRISLSRSTEQYVAICNTQAQYRAVTAETLDAPVERAEFLLSEIRQRVPAH